MDVLNTDLDLDRSIAQLVLRAFTLHALVEQNWLALSVYSRAGAPGGKFSSSGSRRLLTWHFLATRRLWGLTTQVGGARLIIDWLAKFISSGDSESPVKDHEVDKGADTFENCHYTNPHHGQGAFDSSWRAGSG